jgi:hypothetical protein
MSNEVNPSEFSLTARLRKTVAASGDKTLLNDLSADMERKQWAQINDLQKKIEALKAEDDTRLTETWVDERLLQYMAPLKVDLGWEKWLARGAAAGVGAMLTAAFLLWMQHR